MSINRIEVRLNGKQQKMALVFGCHYLFWPLSKLIKYIISCKYEIQFLYVIHEQRTILMKLVLFYTISAK